MPVETRAATAPAWKRAGERSTPSMLATIVWIALHLGRSTARALLVPIVLYFQITGGAARRAARAFLSRALDRPVHAVDVFRNFHAFAACALDRVFLLSGRHQGIHIRRYAPDSVVRYITEGGTLLLTAHLGSFEVLRVFGGNRYDMRFRIVMDRAHAPMITSVLERLNPQLADGIIDSSTGPALALSLRQALDKRCVIGLMADRPTATDPGLAVPFMGGAARLPTAPWQWAAVLGAPVLLCFGLYRGGRHYDLHFELFSGARPPVPRPRRGEFVEDCVRRYAQRLEAYARMAPYNWFNFYDFWADDPTRH